MLQPYKKCKPVKHFACTLWKKYAILNARPILSVKCFFLLQKKNNVTHLTYIILTEEEQNYVG